MAVFLAAKDPDAALRYTWIPPVAGGDGLVTPSITRTSGTVIIEDYQIDADGVVIFFSGGTAGETNVIAASVDTGDGETLVETIYLPIREDAKALSYTVRDVCDFALRKVVGNGNSADSAELDDATERLSDMLAEWARCGADTGIPLPLAAGDTLYAPDGFISAIKHNLRVVCHEHYGQPIDATDMMAARRGLQVIKTANLPSERTGADFY